MKTFTLRASEWLRANRDLYPETPGYEHLREREKRNYEASLWDSVENRGCCLGLHAVQCGIPKKALTDGEPQSIDIGPVEILSYLDCYPWVFVDEESLLQNHPIAEQAMTINDDFDTTDEEKIERLRPLFREHGWEIDWKPNE